MKDVQGIDHRPAPQAEPQAGSRELGRREGYVEAADAEPGEVPALQQAGEAAGDGPERGPVGGKSSCVVDSLKKGTVSYANCPTLCVSS